MIDGRFVAPFDGGVPLRSLTALRVTPDRGIYSGGQVVTILGGPFDPADPPQVTFKGRTCTDLSVLSTIELTCITPPNGLGAADVTLATATETTVLADGYLYNYGTGRITYQTWRGISGSAVSDLLNTDAYPDNPSTVGYLATLDSPRNIDNNYGTRIHGYLVPPVSGDYVFWIASDDRSELRLSYSGDAADTADPGNATRIAHVPGHTGIQQWEKYAAQRSLTLTLTAGQWYYIDILHKEAGGNDHLSVAWQTPLGARSIIPADALAPIDVPPYMQATEPIRPILECVRPNADGSYTAFFGYRNDNAVAVPIAIGDDNRFSPLPIDRGQPALFLPGRHVAVFEVTFSGGNQVWTLRSPNGSRRTSTAGPNGPACVLPPTATPTATATNEPTATITATPTSAPTATPTSAPTATPTDAPTATPTDAPTATPTDAPTATPTDAPTATPTDAPTATPTSTPTATPTSTPTATPTDAPTATPTSTPPPLPNVTLTGGLSVEEAAGMVDGFTIVRDRAESALTVDLMLGGTAQLNDDYVITPTTITLAAGVLSTTVPVLVIDDGLAERDETLIMALASAPTVYNSEIATATFTIVDNDPVLGITAEVAAAAEGGADGRLLIRRNDDLSTPITVTLLVAGDATPGDDYITLPDRIMLPAGIATATLTISPIDDNANEGPESVSVALVAAEVWIDPISATVTIADNDRPRVSVQPGRGQTTEGSSQPATFIVRRDIVTASPLIVTFELGGSAVAGSDYVALQTAVTIPANAPTATVTIVPIDDQHVERNETVTLRPFAGATYAVGTPASATLTIVDNDVTLGLRVVTPTTNEAGGQPAVAVIERSGRFDEPLTATLTIDGTAINGSDYMTLTQPSVLAAGQSTYTITLTAVDDALAEGTEVVRLTLPTIAGYMPTTSSVELAIIDDEQLVTLDTTLETLGETGERGALTLSRSGSTAAPLTVTLLISGTAINGVDYETLPTQVVLPAGSASVVIPLLPIDDRVAEGRETISVRALAGPGYSVGRPAGATFQLYDNADLRIIAEQNAAEYGQIPGRFRIVRGSVATAALTVTLGYTGSARFGVDYSAPLTVVIPAGAPDVAFDVLPIQDARFERAETIVATILPSARYETSQRNGDDSDFINLFDDEGITIKPLVGTAIEGEPDAALSFVIATTEPLSETVVISYTLGGTAEGNSDYLRPDELFVVLPAGVLSTTLTLPLITDSFAEQPETVQVALRIDPFLPFGVPDAAFGTIYDSRPIVAIDVLDGEANESGDTARVRISRAGPTALALDVALATLGRAQSGLDYVPIARTVTIPAGSDAVTVTVTAIDDDLNEGPEQLEILVLETERYLRHADPARQHATLTIRDNDANVNVLAFDIRVDMFVNTTATVNLPNLGAIDLNDDTLSFAIVTPPTNGSALINAAGELIYTPATDFTGSDSIDFSVDDGSGILSNASIAITVFAQPVGLNRPPVTGQTQLTTFQSERLSVDLTTLVSDPDGDALTFELVDSALLGLGVTLDGTLLTYEPLGTLSDTLRIRVSDGQARLVTDPIHLIDIAVRPLRARFSNEAPFANSQTRPFTAGDTTPQYVDLADWGFDPDADPVTFSLVITPTYLITASGSVPATHLAGVGTIALDGSVVTFTPSPTATFPAQIALQYRVTDAFGAATNGYITFFADDPLPLTAIAESTKPAWIEFDSDSILLTGVGESMTLDLQAYNNIGRPVPLPNPSELLFIQSVTDDGKIAWGIDNGTRLTLTALDTIGNLQIKPYWGDLPGRSLRVNVAQVRPAVAVLPPGSVASVTLVEQPVLDIGGDPAALRALAAYVDDTPDDLFTPQTNYHVVIDPAAYAGTLAIGGLIVAQEAELARGRIIAIDGDVLTIEPVELTDLFDRFSGEYLLGAFDQGWQRMPFYARLTAYAAVSDDTPRTRSARPNPQLTSLLPPWVQTAINLHELATDIAAWASRNNVDVAVVDGGLRLRSEIAINEEYKLFDNGDDPDRSIPLKVGRFSLGTLAISGSVNFNMKIDGFVTLYMKVEVDTSQTVPLLFTLTFTMEARGDFDVKMNMTLEMKEFYSEIAKKKIWGKQFPIPQLPILAVAVRFSFSTFFGFKELKGGIDVEFKDYEPRFSVGIGIVDNQPRAGDATFTNPDQICQNCAISDRNWDVRATASVHFVASFAIHTFVGFQITGTDLLEGRLRRVVEFAESVVDNVNKVIEEINKAVKQLNEKIEAFNKAVDDGLNADIEALEKEINALIDELNRRIDAYNYYLNLLSSFNLIPNLRIPNVSRATLPRFPDIPTINIELNRFRNFRNLETGYEITLGIQFEFRHVADEDKEYEVIEMLRTWPPQAVPFTVGSGTYGVSFPIQVKFIDSLFRLRLHPQFRLMGLIPFFGQFVTAGIQDGAVLFECKESCGVGYPTGQGAHVPVERERNGALGDDFDLEEICSPEYFEATNNVHHDTTRSAWLAYVQRRNWDDYRDRGDQRTNLFTTPVPMYWDDAIEVFCGVEIREVCPTDPALGYVEFYRKVVPRDPDLARRYYSFTNPYGLSTLDQYSFVQQLVQRWDPIKEVRVYAVQRWEETGIGGQCSPNRAGELFQRVGEAEILDRDAQNLGSNYDRRQTPYPMWHWFWDRDPDDNPATEDIPQGIYRLFSFTVPRYMPVDLSWHINDQERPIQNTIVDMLPIHAGVFEDNELLRNLFRVKAADEIRATPRDEFWVIVGDVECDNLPEGADIANRDDNEWVPAGEGGYCIRRDTRRYREFTECTIIGWAQQRTRYLRRDGSDAREPVLGLPYVEYVIPNPFGLFACFATFRGDPHIATMDGVRYDSYSLGEFVYLEPRPANSGPDRVTIHARQQRVEGWTRSGALSTSFLEVADWTSWITAAAVDINGTTFEFSIPLVDGAAGFGAGSATLNPLTIRVNGEVQDLPRGLHAFGNDIELIVKGSQEARLVYKGKYSVEVMVSQDAWLDMFVVVPQDDTHHGMLGRPNGRAEDDFLRRDGNPALDAYDIGNSWRITETAASLFTYAPGTGPHTFNMPQDGEPPSLQELAPFMQQAEALLYGACEATTIDEIRTREVAVELFIGRTEEELLAEGVCFYLVQGFITNEWVSGLPVPDAEVMVAKGGQSCTTFTDRNGFYSCQVPSNGELGQIEVQVTKRGSAQTTLEVTELPPAASFRILAHDFTVAPTTLALYGAVTDGQTGATLGGAELRIDGPENAGFVKTFGEADEFGTYLTYLMLDNGVSAGSNRYFVTYAVPGVDAPDDNRVRRVVNQPFSDLELNELNPLELNITLTGVVLDFFGRISFLAAESIAVEGMRVLIEPTQPHPQFTAPCDVTSLIYVGPDPEEYDPQKETTDPNRAGTFGCQVPIEDVTPFEVQARLIGDDLFSVVLTQTLMITPTGVRTGDLYPVVLPALQLDSPLIQVTGDVRGPDGAPVAGARITVSGGQVLGGSLTAVALADGSYRLNIPLTEGANGFGVNGTLDFSVSYFNASDSASIDFFGVTVGEPATFVQDFTVRGSSLTFYGRVIDTNTNAPVYDAEILITSPQFEADARYLCGVSQLYGPNTVGSGRNWYRPDAYVMPIFPGMIDPPEECRTTVPLSGPDDLTVVYDVRARGENHVITRSVPLADLGQWRSVAQDMLIPFRVITPTTLVLSGTITSPDGQPLEGATVYADVLDDDGESVLALSAWQLLFGADSDPRKRTRTDGQGHYVLTVDMPEGVITGTVEYEVAYRNVSVYDTLPYAIAPYTSTTLLHDMLYGVRTVYIYGSITNTYGVELPQTSVQIASPDLRTAVGNVCRTQADLNGGFVCVAQTAANRPISLSVSAEGIWGSTLYTVSAAIDNTAAVVEYRLDPQNVDLTVLELEGVVTTSAGEPLEGVEVTVSSTSLYRVASGLTDPFGGYRLYAVVKPITDTTTYLGTLEYFVGYGEAGTATNLPYAVEANATEIYTRNFTLDLRVVSFDGHIYSQTLFDAVYGAALQRDGYFAISANTLTLFGTRLNTLQRPLVLADLATAGVTVTTLGSNYTMPADDLGTLLAVLAAREIGNPNQARQKAAANNTQVRVVSDQYGQLCEYALLASFSKNNYACDARVFSSQPFSVTYRLSGEWGSATIPGRVTQVPAIGERVKLTRDLYVRTGALRLTGRALDRDGRPLSGADVTITSEQFAGRLATVVERMATARTDNNGYYETYAILRDGRTTANLTFQSTVGRGTSAISVNTTQSVAVTPRALNELRQDFSYPQRRVSLTGVVTNETLPDLPVDGNLRIYDLTNARTLCETTVSTKPGSSFRCDYLVLTDTNYVLDFYITGTWGSTQTTREVNGTDTAVFQPLAVRTRAIVLNGRVTRPDGTPLPDAEVTLSSYTIRNAQLVTLKATTDANGNYSTRTLLAPGVGNVNIDYLVKVAGNQASDRASFSFNANATSVTVSRDLVVRTAQLTFQGDLINALMGTSGPWSKIRHSIFGDSEVSTTYVIIDSPTEGFLCTTSGIIREYECTATISTTVPFDVRFRVYGDWGEAELFDRVETLPPPGGMGEFSAPLVVTPTMVHIQGTALLTYTEPYSVSGPLPLAGAKVRTNLVGALSDPLLSAQWNVPTTGPDGRFDLYVVLRQVDGELTGTFPLIFDNNQRIPAFSFTAQAGQINTIVLTQTFAIAPPQPPLDPNQPPPNARTISLRAVHYNALAPNLPETQPKQHIRIVSPVYGELCNTAEPSLADLLSGKDPEPVTEVTCRLVVTNDNPQDLIITSFGPYGTVERTVYVDRADMPAAGGLLLLSEEIQLEPTTLRLSGLVVDEADTPMGNVNTEINVIYGAIDLLDEGQSIGRIDVDTQVNGLYEAYMLLPQWLLEELELSANTTSLKVDLDYRLTFDDILVNYTVVGRTILLDQLNDVWAAWDFTARRVRFTGHVYDANYQELGNVGLPAIVSVTSPDLVNAFYCDATVDAATGEFACDALVETGQPFEARLRAFGQWGSADAYVDVTALNSVGQTTVVEQTVWARPTSILIYGEVTDPYGAPLEDARLIFRNDNIVSFRSDIEPNLPAPPIVNAFAERALEVTTDADGRYSAYMLLRQNIVSGDFEVDVSYFGVGKDEVRSFSGLRLQERNVSPVPYDFELSDRIVIFDGRIRNQHADGMGLIGDLIISDSNTGETLCSTQLRANRDGADGPVDFVWAGDYRCQSIVHTDPLSVTYVISSPYASLTLPPIAVPQDVVAGVYTVMGNYAVSATTVDARGRVVDGIGNPVAGVTLRVDGPVYGVNNQNTNTSGDYRIKVAVAQGVTASALGVRAVYDQIYNNQSGMTVLTPLTGTLVANAQNSFPTDIVFDKRRVRVQGYVGNAVNAAAATAGLNVRVVAAGVGQICSTTTWSSGYYQCPAVVLEPGAALLLTATVTGDWGSRTITRSVTAAEFPAVGTTGDLVWPLSIAPTTLRLYGVVRDPAGRGLGGVRLTVGGNADAIVNTTSNGGFESDLLFPNGVVTADLTLDLRYRDLTVRRTVTQALAAGALTAREQPLTFAERVMTLGGRVVNSVAGGVPLAESNVRISSPLLGEFCVTTSNANGDYSCPATIVTGTTPIVLNASGSWGSRTLSDTLTVSELPEIGRYGNVTRAIDVAPTTLYVSGSVRDPQGGALAGATVALSGAAERSLTTTADGRFATYLVFSDTVTAAAFDVTVSYGTLSFDDVLNVPLSVGGLVSTTLPYTFGLRRLTFFGEVRHALLDGVRLGGGTLGMANATQSWCNGSVAPSGVYPSCSVTVDGDLSAGLTFTTTVNGTWGRTQRSVTIPAAQLPAIGQQKSVALTVLAQPTTLRVQGQLADGDDQPLGGATVLVAGTVAGAATTVANGTYSRLFYLPAATGRADLDITLTAGSFSQSVTRSVALIAEQVVTTTANAEFNQRRLTLTGSVVNALAPATGLGGTRVVLAAAGGTLCDATTAASGSFNCPAVTLTGGYPQGLALTATISGPYGSAVVTRSVPAGALPAYTQSGSAALSLALPATTLALNGTLRDADGAPLGGAQLTFGGGTSGTATTAADGRYSVRLTYPQNVTATHVTIAVRVGQITLNDGTAVTLAAQTVTTATHDLVFGARDIRLRGTVTNPNNNNAPVAATSVSFIEATRGTLCSTTTASNGTYSCPWRQLVGSAAETLTLTVRLANSFTTQTQTVTLTPAQLPPLGGAADVTVNRALPLTTLRLAGTLVDSTGTPRSGSLALSGDASATGAAGADGSFALTLLFNDATTTANLNWVATVNGYALTLPLAIDLTPQGRSEETLTVTFGVRGLRVAGVISNTLIGRPLAGAQLTLQRPDGSTLCTTTTAGDGRYACPAAHVNVVAGDLGLTATVSGGWGSAVQTVSVSAANLPPVATTGDGAIDLAVAPTSLLINGNVTDGNGPLAGAVVQVSGTGLLQPLLTTSAADGSYSVVGTYNSTLLSGTLDVLVTQSGYFNEQRSVTLSNLSANALNGVTVPPIALIQSDLLPACNEFSDEFVGGLAPGWRWVRESAANWSVDDRPNHLRIMTQPGQLWQGGNNTQNALLRPIAGNDFEIITDLEFAPSANYHNAGLVIYLNDDNFLYLNRIYSSGQTGGPQVIEYLHEVNGSYTNLFAVTSATTIYLKIQKIGTTASGYFSTDGINWTLVGTHNAVTNLNGAEVGIAASHVGSGVTSIPADFDWFCAVTLPHVTAVTPLNNTKVATGTVEAVTFDLSEPLDPATVHATGAELRAAGADGALDTADDVVLTTTVSYQSDGNRVMLAPSAALPNGLYRATLLPEIRDLAGNALARATTTTFEVRTPIRWISDSSGGWHEPARWSSGSVPGADDLVIIDRPVEITVTISTGNQSVYGLMSAENVRLTGGTFAINGYATLDGRFLHTEGTLSGGGWLEARGGYTWRGGSQTGNGEIRIPAGASAVFDGSGYRYWYDGRRFVVDGTLVLDNSRQVYTYNNGNKGIVVNAGGVLEVRRNGTLIDYQNGWAVVITNNGVINKTAAGGEAYFEAYLTNNGLVDFPSGTLSFAYGVDNNADIRGGDGARLLLYGGANLAAGSVFSTTGSLHVAGGTVNQSGALNIGTLTVSNGTANIGGQVALDSVALTNGTLNLNVPLTVTTMTHSNGTFRSDRTLTVLDGYGWTAGSLFGTGDIVISEGVTMTLSGSDYRYWYDGRRFVVDGTLVLDNSRQVYTYHNGNKGIVVNAGGVLEVRRNGTLIDYQNGWAVVITNNGVINKTAAGGEAYFEAYLTNNGLVDFPSGTLSFAYGVDNNADIRGGDGARLLLYGGGTWGDGAVFSSTGALQVAGGTLNQAGVLNTQTIVVSGGTANLNGVLTANIVNISNGTLNANGALTVITATLSNGTLTGSGALTTTQSFRWSDGSLAGNGRLIVPAGGTGTFSGTNSRYWYDARAITVGGTLVWDTGARIYTYNSGGKGIDILPGGVLDIRRDGFLIDYQSGTGFTINNAGTLVKSAGSGAAIFEATLNNSGIFDVQSGIIDAYWGFNNSGTVTVTGGAALRQYGGGTWSTAATVSTTGRVEFAGGTFTLQGGLLTASEGIYFNGGTVNVDGAVEAGMVTLSNGTLSGSGMLIVRQGLTWSNGNIAGSGSISVTASSVLAITGSSSRSWSDARTISVAGTLVWDATGFVYTYNSGAKGITIATDGILDFRRDGQPLSLQSGTKLAIVNQGVIRKSSGTGTLSVQATVTNNGRIEELSGAIVFY